MRTIRINQGVRVWGARLLIGVLLFFNLQCALSFLSSADLYAGAFELDGTAGRAMVQGLGLLFVMWNVPYAVAFYHPQRYRVSLYEAVVMQAIGLGGETFLSLAVTGGHEVLLASVHRFMLFDGVGLLLLLLALGAVRGVREG
jgi:hypothetical protein